jgi:sugar phosphate isomerase/epimerase
MNMKSNRNAGLSRRGFLTGVGAGTLAAATAASASSPAEKAKTEKRADLSKDALRLGSVSWNFRSIAAGPPWTDAIDTIADLGFRGVELIVAQPDQLDATLAEPHFSNLLRQLGQHKMVVSQFVLFQPVTADLGSPDPEKRKRALAVFEKGCQVASKLGAPMINMVAPWPTVFRKDKVDYLPRYYSTETTMPGPKFQFDVPRNFDWPKAWSDFVSVMKEATGIAKAAGILFSLENHTHTFVPGPDAFLHLWDEVRDSTLGFALDIGWIQLQREYPVVAIYKTRGRLMNVHLRDIDGFAYRFVPPGSGCMDFEGVVRALRDIGYSGFMSFEQDGVPDMRYALSRGKQILEEILAKTA